MRSILYVALVFAVLARSVVVTAFPHPDEYQLLLKSSPDSVANTKRSLRVAGQEVVPSSWRNGNGGIWKSRAQRTNRIVKLPEIDMAKLIEKAKAAQALKKIKKRWQEVKKAATHEKRVEVALDAEREREPADTILRK
ncbi:hypothetical protein F442_13219 [Phytophthora nicotianae P10297]|uniref:RxLR effector protein n=3 Tax=Phytophthora nicotianae TaxID=4792 RepID=W2YW17_PHYNI|nr:hypothetical protein L915_13041 [Phytophthora nicotianae]ETO70063.1 hypothetical protein F444_13425 [Phytophthora nicotianae P1976]ETP39332.1 hypothetical protein F442_13219 [Phytophthora nicotianae P10297]